MFVCSKSNLKNMVWTLIMWVLGLDMNSQLIGFGLSDHTSRASKGWSKVLQVILHLSTQNLNVKPRGSCPLALQVITQIQKVYPFERGVLRIWRVALFEGGLTHLKSGPISGGVLQSVFYSPQQIGWILFSGIMGIFYTCTK